MSDNDFVEFPKIFRLQRRIIVTEKIDGTNACVHVAEDGTVTAGSRTRWISPDADNFGFAFWVSEHREELRGLGPGRHFGEWWGQGIQRRYDLKEKRFSLFNVGRWLAEEPHGEARQIRPPCCDVVPILGLFDTFDTDGIRMCMNDLKEKGSVAAPGFMRPEGIVIFHAPSGNLYKQTIEKDDEPKSRAASPAP
jgi:hypothetical protein